MRIDRIRHSVQHGRPQPAGSTLVGYAALIEGLDADAPPPETPAVILDRRIKVPVGESHIFRDGFAQYGNHIAVPDTFSDHLTFALKYERLDLLALKRIFLTVPESVMEDHVRGAPSSGPRRRGWFLYEFLTGRRLDLPSADNGAYVDAIDPDFWQTGLPVNSPRHRVRDNLPGNAGFCPLIERRAAFETPLSEMSERILGAHLAGADRELGRRLVRRLLLKDSRSSFLIEGENPSNVDIQRWSDHISRAGEAPLSLDRMIGVQRDLLRSNRFVVPGLRRDGVFLGDRVDNMPSPFWIGARPEDLPDLINALIRADERLEGSEVDPVSHAAAVSFGWVFIHPFEDGNGRTHRYLMQHVLARRGVRPGGLTIPVAKVIWEDIQGYRDVLVRHDQPLMPLMDWRPTGNGNVEVLNDTADLYRYFDATEQALFLRGCVERVLHHTIPSEIDEVRRRDAYIAAAREVIDMPERQLDLFASVVMNNGGEMSKAKRNKIFQQMTDEEVSSLVSLVREVFSPPSDDSAEYRP